MGVRDNKETKMTNETNGQCSVTGVGGSGSFGLTGQHACRNKATVTRLIPASYLNTAEKVERRYCGTHDPVATEERRAKKQAEDTRRWEARCAMMKGAEDRNARVGAARAAMLTTVQMILGQAVIDGGTFVNENLLAELREAAKVVVRG